MTLLVLPHNLLGAVVRFQQAREDRGSDDRAIPDFRRASPAQLRGISVVPQNYLAEAVGIPSVPSDLLDHAQT